MTEVSDQVHDDESNGAELVPTRDVLLDVIDGVATVTLNRPERLNAMTPEMRNRYLATLRDLGDDDDVGAIVVTGAGRGFCAGSDFQSLDGLDGAAWAETRKNPEVQFDIALTINKPVIAAVNGPAAGVGFAHALMADLRFASTDATFVTAFSKLGLVAEGGISWLLPRLVGTARALDFLWSSRPVRGEEAFATGLVQRLVSPEDLLPSAHAYARGLLDTASPYSIGVMKQRVYGDWATSREVAWELSKELVEESMGRPEFAERAARRGSSRS